VYAPGAGGYWLGWEEMWWWEELLSYGRMFSIQRENIFLVGRCFFMGFEVVECDGG